MLSGLTLVAIDVPSRAHGAVSIGLLVIGIRVSILEIVSDLLSLRGGLEGPC